MSYVFGWSKPVKNNILLVIELLLEEVIFLEGINSFYPMLSWVETGETCHQ